MKRVITYGTYDLLHYGHIRLLERAKELGDYLIVAVTADDFDKTRGKINVQQSLIERVEAVRATGLADEIIVEEYEGQKIDDIIKYDIDIFTVGSDWIGKFDYLKEYCDVIYLERTEGISSTEIRSKDLKLRLGLIGNSNVLLKVARESKYVNGIEVVAVYTDDYLIKKSFSNEQVELCCSFSEVLQKVDSVYIASAPKDHYEQIKNAIQMGVHVLFESPISLCVKEAEELFDLARKGNVILMDLLKTAYSTAFHRLLLLIKTGVIGQVISVDVTCTSIRNLEGLSKAELSKSWNSICTWGPTAMLPIFYILGREYSQNIITTRLDDEEYMIDSFTKIDYYYKHAVASLKVGQGVKSEGELIISGTKGYIYVPAPWWKTDYFEIRYENPTNNKRYFYQLDGEGIRNEIVAFVRSIINKKLHSNISEEVSLKIVQNIEQFYSKKNLFLLNV